MKHIQVWQQATVVATEDITPTVRQFLLRPASGQATRWDGGAHLQVQVAVNGQLQMRHYSLVGTGALPSNAWRGAGAGPPRCGRCKWATHCP
jgi:ferredoxin-NADP reductase